MPEPVLEVVDVRKRYGRTVALDGVSLAVEEGERFGLLGPNGAGKTTLISILCGLASADSGEVRLFGKPFARSDRELRRLVGIGTQDLSIYPDLTASENLQFFGKLYGLRGPELERRVSEVLEEVGLADRAGDRAGTFSGGMKRRLNLAAAVVHRPRLLFLDEPTTGVDPQSRNHIFEQVKSQNAAGMTVIYTSHYMEEVQTLCPRIAILDAGRVRACDLVSDLLARVDSVARLHFAHQVSPRMLEFVSRLDFVKRCGPLPSRSQTLEVVSDSITRVLPRVLAACLDLQGEEPTTLDLDQPNLERVFLHLTGHELRD